MDRPVKLDECDHLYQKGACTYCGVPFMEETDLPIYNFTGEETVQKQTSVENFTGGKAVYTERLTENRPSGLSTHYYELPANATELRHLINYKKMPHGIGEAFCSLYRLDDNGERRRNLEKVIYYAQKELEYMDNDLQ